mmetsp:Transcript_57216/g.170582  ORF Transcript_57216/g.170582 Transcript_57216/m.170582 type:complete len:200 (-) Transcript_57216:261-860(-)
MPHRSQSAAPRDFPSKRQTRLPEKLRRSVPVHVFHLVSIAPPPPRGQPISQGNCDRPQQEHVRVDQTDKTLANWRIGMQQPMSDAPRLVAVFVAAADSEGGGEVHSEPSRRVYSFPLISDGYFLIIAAAGRNSSHRAFVPDPRRGIPQRDALPVLVARAVGREHDMNGGSAASFQFALSRRAPGSRPAQSSFRVPLSLR